MAMPRGQQAFPKSEYSRRLSLVKAEMEKRDVDTLLVTNSANITYLTGYTAKSAYVPQGLVISLEEEEPVFFTRRMDAPAAIHQMYIDRSRVFGYSEDLIAHPERDGYDAIIDFLLENRVAKSTIALECRYLPASTVDKFKTRISSATTSDFTNVVAWIRGVKSDLEIAVMREAAAITDAGMLRAREVIRPGTSEAQAAAEIIATLVRGTNGKPGTDLASFYLCASPRTSTCHIRWTEDALQSGAQVNLEFSGVRHGYTSPLMRTICLGKASDTVRKLHDAEVEGLEAALAAAKPGATCGDVAAAFNRAIERRGFKKESRCGYAVGIEWTEPTASLKVGDPTILRPNMTFHLMLGNWIDEDLGYVISETFRVTEAGSEALSKIPRDLLEI